MPGRPRVGWGGAERGEWKSERGKEENRVGAEEHTTKSKAKGPKLGPQMTPRKRCDWKMSGRLTEGRGQKLTLPREEFCRPVGALPPDKRKANEAGQQRGPGLCGTQR